MFEDIKFKFWLEGMRVTDREGGCFVIGNDGSGGKEMVRSQCQYNGHNSIMKQVQ